MKTPHPTYQALEEEVLRDAWIELHPELSQGQYETVVDFLKTHLHRTALAAIEAVRVEEKECPAHGHSPDDSRERGECYGYDETYNNAVKDCIALGEKFMSSNETK